MNDYREDMERSSLVRRDGEDDDDNDDNDDVDQTDSTNCFNNGASLEIVAWGHGSYVQTLL